MKTLKTFFLLAFLSVHATLFSQTQVDDWKYINNKDGIELYTRFPEDSNLKEIKFEFIVNATPIAIKEYLSDVTKFGEWVYSCSESKKIKIDKNKELYYIKFDFPWPLWDRDLVQESISTIHEDGSIHIETTALKGIVDQKKHIVRIHDNKIKWQIIPLPENRSYLKYYAKGDPGGSIPSWLINMAVAIGPKKTMVQLNEKIRSLKK